MSDCFLRMENRGSDDQEEIDAESTNNFVILEKQEVCKVLKKLCMNAMRIRD